MTYRLLAFLDDDSDPPNVREVDALLVDGMSVADRALEDVWIRISLTPDRSALVAEIATPDTMPPMMDTAAVLDKAREVALGSDILDVPGGGDGMIWNDTLPPSAQVIPFTAPPIVH